MRKPVQGIANAVRQALTEAGHAVSYGHETQEGDGAVFVMDAASGEVLAEVVVRRPAAGEERSA